MLLFREQNRAVTATELDHEETLLEDSAKLQAHYNEKVTILENELKSLTEVLLVLILIIFRNINIIN